MKELSIEEKAKRYDEVINRIKHYVIDEYGCSRIKVADVFPELKESEGERIRKEILDYIIKGSESLYDVQRYGKEKFEKWVAWLEKESEHAKFCDSIQVGDKVTRNEDGVLVNLSQLKRVAKKDEKQGEQKPAEWSEKDESTTEDLGEYINELSKQFPDVSFAKLSRIAVRVAKWKKEHLWKPADGDDLPEIDREVIALLNNGKVVFAHRPPEYWDGKDIVTCKVTRNYPKTYDKGGWNIPDTKWWLDVKLPKEIEL